MIVPIAITTIDWTSYLNARIQSGDMAPTRAIDNAGLKLNDPVTFLASLNPDPMKGIRESYVNKHTDLIHLLFLTDTDCEVTAALAVTRLRLTPLREQLILAGTLTDYMDAVLAYSKYNHILCTMMNAIFCYLDRGGFRECFTDFERHNHPDKTFSFKPRRY